MADDGRTRARRHRLHKAGNHALCRPISCKFAPVSLPSPGTSPVVADSGETLNPRQAMAELAGQLRDACAANPADAVLAREYRLTLMELARDSDANKSDPFADIIAGLSGPVPAEVGDAAD